jgi:hypothetical protein
MYDFAAEPGNNELTVSEGEIITITNPVRTICLHLIVLYGLILRFDCFVVNQSTLFLPAAMKC